MFHMSVQRPARKCPSAFFASSSSLPVATSSSNFRSDITYSSFRTTQGISHHPTFEEIGGR